MTAQPFKITLPGRLENLETIGDFIARSAQALGLDKDQTYQAQLAVDEACANVIQHGSLPDTEGSISLECCRQGDACVFTLRDQGQAFDPTTVPPPNLQADLHRRKPGGLGIYLMRKLMDKVSYRTEQGTNILTLTKKLKP